MRLGSITSCWLYGAGVWYVCLSCRLSYFRVVACAQTYALVHRTRRPLVPVRPEPRRLARLLRGGRLVPDLVRNFALFVLQQWLGGHILRLSTDALGRTTVG